MTRSLYKHLTTNVVRQSVAHESTPLSSAGVKKPHCHYGLDPTEARWLWRVEREESREEFIRQQSEYGEQMRVDKARRKMLVRYLERELCWFLYGSIIMITDTQDDDK